MRRAVTVLTLLLAGFGARAAEPVGEDTLAEIYESCVTSAVGNAPSVNAAMRMRYCFCVRDQVQREYTAESLGALRRRIAANTVSGEDHERRERVYDTCRPNIEGGR